MKIQSMKRNLVKFVAAAALAALPALLAPSEARAGFFFDQNYPDVKWKTFETEHFIFHYYTDSSKKHPNSTEFTARRAAKYAEVMYPKVCEQFDYFLTEKVNVLIRDQEENANGFAVYTEDWMTIWATPLYFPLRGRIDWIPDVMTHEYAHIVSLKANENRGIGVSFGASAGGLEEDGRNNVAYGGTIPFGEGNSAPFWWTEGGAEYWTHNVGYNHWGSSRDALMRMSILEEDATLTLDQLSTRGDKMGLDGERGYNHGYSIGLYLAEKYGEETYAKFAEASKAKTRFKWENVIEEVLGITPDEMWAGWVEWNREKYGRVKAELEKQGMHEGTHATWTKPQWLSDDPDKQAAWEAMGKRKRRWHREKLGLYNGYNGVSPAGNAWGYISTRGAAGLKLTFTAPDELPAISGTWLDPEAEAGDDAETEPEAAGAEAGHSVAANDGDGDPAALSDKEKLERIPSVTISGVRSDWAFSPDGKKIAVTTLRLRSCLPHFELDGYEWSDIVVYDLETIRELADRKAAGENDEPIKFGCGEHQRYGTQITDDARVTVGDWSPDGEWISVVKYGDGTYNVGKIRPDGSDLTMITNFVHGEAVGSPKWSPDGKKLVFYFYKPEQQDIWEINADGTGFRPLTWDKAEDRDATYSEDGKHVYYSSDRTGIFNVYKLELATGKVTQVTNVLGSALYPVVTGEGNLVYTGFNAFGFQTYALGKDDFYDHPVEGYDVPSDEESDTYIATLEELPEITDERKYSAFKDMQPPVFFPISRFEDRNLQAGGELIWWDYAGKHALIVDVLMGQNRDYIARYINDMWRPTIALIWARFDRSRELAFEYNPGEFGEIKLRSRVDFYLALVNWQVGPRYDLGLSTTFRSFDVGFGGDAATLKTNGPWSFGSDGISNTVTAGGSVRYFTVDRYRPRGTFDINPRGAREINASYDFGFTKIVDGGGDIDDGQRLSEYPFHTLKASYAEYYAVPWWKYLEHTLQFTTQAGFIDRNVQFNDELFAGGQHPYASGSDINVNTQFAGFEPFSVIGETMLITSLAYRMPLYRDWDKKIGPFYFDSVYLQFFGTAGNVWSFRPNPTDDQLVTRSRTGNNRELPFVGLFDDKAAKDLEDDYAGVPIEGMGGNYGKRNPGLFEKAFPVAYKNGNRLLTDVGTEIRIRAYAYNYNPWFSFFRIAYGVQDTTGVGDQNGDGVFRDLPPADDPVGEIERAGFRYYIGIGTGW